MTNATDALRDVIAFLMGEAPLEGRWFGDEDVPLVAGKYWWRTPLRKASEALATPAGSASGEDAAHAAFYNLHELTQCRCHDDYKSRSRIDPDCNHDYREDVDALQAEVARAKDEAMRHWNGEYLAEKWKREAAEAEAARLREDAARYRWLRHDAGFAGWGLPRMPVSCPDNIANCKSPHTREISGAALDAAIDAAMGSANGQG